MIFASVFIIGNRVDEQAIQSALNIAQIHPNSISSTEMPQYAKNPYTHIYWDMPIMENLYRKRKEEKGIIIGIVNEKIYHAGVESIWGVSDPKRGVILISIPPLKGKNVEERMAKVILHELAHLYGLPHCQRSQCPASSSVHIHHLDEKELHLCPTCRAEIEEAEIYFPYPQKSKVKFVYTPKYCVDLGYHVFPTEKYSLVKDRLVKKYHIKNEDFLEPPLPSWDDLQIILTSQYIEDLKNARVTYTTYPSELPVREDIILASRYSAGGTFLASQLALKGGVGFHIGGGFHHAFPDHAEGFCYINDVAYALATLKKHNTIKKGMVIDLDLHQGNGTAYIFRNEKNIFTFSMHQEDIYPKKEKSDLDIGLPSGTTVDVYISKLRKNVPAMLEFFLPDLVIYVAGADPYQFDQLGDLKLSKNDLLIRDQIIIGECWQRKTPITITLAGGYAYKIQDTLEIHTNTAKVCLSLFKLF